MKATMCAIAVVACFLAAGTAGAAWRLVDQSGNGTYTTITEAMAAAQPGEQVAVKAGVYSASSGETMPILMKPGVELIGYDAIGTVIIDGEGLHRVMKCLNGDYNTKISRLVITGGFAPSWDRNGAGLYIGDVVNQNAVHINSVIFDDNHADAGFGGGVFADETTSNVIFNTCTFSNNTASGGGGFFAQGPDPAGIVNCVFSNNAVTGYGGGLTILNSKGGDPSRDLIIQRLTFSGNSAGLGGSSVSTYVSVRFWDCIMAFSPSAVTPFNTNAGASVTLECCDVYGNAGGDYVGAVDGQLGVSGNISDDPEFCGVEFEPDDPYGISINSPCAEENYPSCGTIGARPVKCGIPYLRFPRDWLEYYIGFGETFCQPLAFENGGDLPLDWLVYALVIPSRGAGGPDAYGYRWTDSDTVGGPVFSWQDISQVGTPVVLGNNDATLVPLPFTFPFYDSEWFEFALSSNGYLTFGSNWTASANGPIPDPTQPNELIAPFWEDLDPSLGGTIHYYALPGAARMIVQFTDVPIASAVVAGEYTFQVILDSDGTITFQYLEMEGLLTGATIGIENSDGSTGLQVACNESYVHDDLAVKIDLGPSAPSWLVMEPVQGTLDPGEDAEVSVCVDCTGLDPGFYNCHLVVMSDDYNNPVLYIPLTAQIFPTGVDEEVAGRVTLKGNYPNPFNPKTLIAYELPRPSSVRLRIYDAGGRLVRTILDSAWKSAGPHEEAWDGTDDAGTRLASGVYFCRMEVDDQTVMGKMVLLK
jgi:hypothetical protein